MTAKKKKENFLTKLKTYYKKYLIYLAGLIIAILSAIQFKVAEEK